jgi:hypothetical protein
LMDLGSVAGEGIKSLGQRSIISLLPSALLATFVLALLGSGAPGDPSLNNIVETMGSLEAPEIALMVVSVVAATIIMQPFQIAVVQALEGYWTPFRRRGGTAPLRRAMVDMGVELQRRRRRALELQLQTSSSSIPEQTWAEGQLRYYPDKVENLLPTRLGNTLRASEEQAGGRYGLDTNVAYPRLYPLVSERLAAQLRDFTGQLDTAAHLCVVLMAATVVSGVLLVPSGSPGWLVVPAVTGALAWFAYRAAITAAKLLGNQWMVSFDLHRFDLLVQLHYRLPGDLDEERRLNETVTELLTELKRSTLDDEQAYAEEGIPVEPIPRLNYEHPQAESEPTRWEWDALLGPDNR